jgi:hypothetical protein
MSNIPRFAEYAAAFEKAFESDDWSVVEPFFHPNAVYEIGLPLLGRTRCDGRDEILAWFKDVLDRFDRRFASRKLALLDGPEDRGDAVWIRGNAVYGSPGVPDLVLELEETVRFDGDRIVHLEDAYAPQMKAEVEAYVREHGPKLGIEISEGS